MDVKERQRILVIDEDQDRLWLLNHTLELEGFDVIVVADGDAAMRVIDTLSPDLVILDTESPGVESLETLDHVRQHSEVPIIILSLEYEAEMLREVISRGADDLIRKPFGVRLFMARVKAKIRRSRKESPGRYSCPVRLATGADVRPVYP